jgi:aryl carrier-like protein
MTSKSSTTSTADGVREAIASASTAPEMQRQQFARAVDMAAAGFRAFGELQKVNLQMGERAALLLSQAADNARKAGSPIELAQIQSQLVMYEWQELTRYSQELMMAFTRVASQPAAASLGEQSASTSAAKTVGNGLADAMGAAAPMVQAWQQVFSGMADAAQARH